MFFFDHARRHSLRPRSLDDGRVLNFKRQVDAYLALSLQEQLQTDVPPVWKYEFQTDVIENLTLLSYGKCPFCERDGVRLQPYRFRPPAYATPAKSREDKLCYLWKAFEWENLFPICRECTPDDKSYFPTLADRISPNTNSLSLNVSNPTGFDELEGPLLVYPGEMSASWGVFRITLDGILTGRERNIRETINHFKLNRPELISDRAEAIKLQIQLLQQRHVLSPFNIDEKFEDVEFGGVLYIFLSELANHIPDRFGWPLSTTTVGLIAQYKSWLTRPDFQPALRAALETYRRETSPSFDELRSDKSASKRSPSPPPLIFEDVMVPVSSESSTLDAVPKPPKSKADLNHSRLVEVGIKQFKSLEAISFALPTELPEDVRNRALEEKWTEVPKAPCVLILGENATGKSSILEAIALTCISDDMRERLKLDPARLITNPEFMGERNGKELSASRVFLRFEDGKQLTLDISAESTSHKREAAREEEEDNRLPQVFAYGAHRLYGKKQRDLAIRNIDTLFKDDQHISNPEPWLVELSKKNPDALNEVVAALRHIIQIDGNFKTIEVRNGECVINIEKKRKGDSSYILQQKLDFASSGYKAVLAVVCDIFRTLLQQTPEENAREARKAKPIILIDEIEAHLHPRWKLQIVSGLRRALPNATFILTSHDPLCVRGMYPGEVMMLNRYQNEDDPEKLPEVVERVSGFENIGSMTIEQLLTSDLFQLFTTDDRATEIDFAKIVALLSRKNAREKLNGDETEALRKFQAEIAQSLPYGRTQVSVLVQEAVAKYLSQRRQAGEERRSELRRKAIDSIHDFLRGELP